MKLTEILPKIEANLIEINENLNEILFQSKVNNIVDSIYHNLPVNRDKWMFYLLSSADLLQDREAIYSAVGMMLSFIKSHISEAAYEQVLDTVCCGLENGIKKEKFNWHHGLD